MGMLTPAERISLGGLRFAVERRLYALRRIDEPLVGAFFESNSKDDLLKIYEFLSEEVDDTLHNKMTLLALKGLCE